MEYLTSDHPLARALAQRGYTDLTAVQSAVLAPETTGRDLLVSAQTGSGKTVAYGLALADTILGDAPRLPPAGAPLALVVAPTRELALQVRNELEWLYQAAGGRVVACVGGMDPRAERRTLAQGTHIVVGTPGRLRDHLERGGLDASALRAVVLDEADEMLDMGFREDLEAILDEVPAERRTLLFSATLPREITDMAKRYQRDAWRISLAAGAQGHADIEHKAIRVAPTEIEHAVVNTLRYFDAPTAMVFCGTREAVRHLQSGLLERGFGVVALSGELSQNERNKALQELRDGRARVCVATDVAARGIDLPNLDLVIHAELPRTAETMQHRSGRTGRAGRKGVSVLMVPLSRWRRAQQLLQTAGVQAEWIAAPSADDIRGLDQQRLLTHPMFDEVSGDDDVAMAKTLLEGRSADDIALALVRLYRSRLPAPEEIFTQSAEAPPPAQGGGFEKRRGRRDDAAGDGNAVWFRLNIGRQKNADPRWILPLICRQGHVSKQDIGAIRIFDRDTRFEVAAHVAERFQAAIRSVKHPEGRIEPVEGVEPGEFRKPPRAHTGERPHGGERTPYGERPQGERPQGDHPRGPRPQGEKPFNKAGDKPFKGKSFKVKLGKKPQPQD
ncbi:DEAD/DEAH box helicase [Magnetospirillum sp. 64-120]|uniref:DEAD/DEAH box helicase n=1 Tax=Magnetospirillum sp. 64-120 TaxID=1895778 RepID=UPI00092A2710|nr:DEAD/DEAH box helicase [Magnetospirillum sp. 64-120]OJX71793.1 MAG: DEAD/DEAH box helicase [Magnetospirillum sp. 64-120]